MFYRTFGSIVAMLTIGPILTVTAANAQPTPLAPFASFERLVGAEAIRQARAWSLLLPRPDGSEVVMSATFRRLPDGNR